MLFPLYIIYASNLLWKLFHLFCYFIFIVKLRIKNAQSASLRSLWAAESTAAETNAASSFERPPAMDQIYQILNLFSKFRSNCWIWRGTVTRMCVNSRKKNRLCVNYRNPISKVVCVKKLTCSAPSTCVSKRHWVGQSEPVNPRPPLSSLPSPSHLLPAPLWKMRSFRPEISEISAQVRHLRPGFPNDMGGPK